MDLVLSLTTVRRPFRTAPVPTRRTTSLGPGSGLDRDYETTPGAYRIRRKAAS
jgi:hypothetical protein